MLFLVLPIGFDAAGRARLERLLADCSALGAQWRATDDGLADLWIVSGATARSIGGGLIEVEGDAPLRFRPAEMPHPVAFTQPLDASISTGNCFDPESMQSLNVLLTQLARWLGPKLTQQALVEQLVANGASFTRSNVIEVRSAGRLLALVDFEGDTAVAPDATPADVRIADWRLRPRTDAAIIPPGFRITPTQQVLWQFAHRTQREGLLPARYRRLPIHLRNMPALPVREIADRQLHVLRELAYGPRTFAQLAQITGAGEKVLARDLGALYLVSAITCDPGRSRAAREQRRGAQIGEGADLSFIGARPAELGELTAPGFAR
jgi:hypothetical protein